MKILGLDLSLRGTGICLLSGDGPVPSVHTELIAQPQASTTEDRVLRLIRIADAILVIIARDQPDYIVIEAAAKNQVWQAAAIGEVHGVVKTQIYIASGKLPIVKEATEMRKFIIGKIDRVTVEEKDQDGNVKKRISYGDIPGARKGKLKRATIKDIIELKLKSQGFVFPTQDEMDAYVTARYGWDKIFLGTDLNLVNVKKPKGKKR